MKTYKVCDACDCLVIGATYNAVPSGRMIRFTNASTGAVVHLYKHDVVRGLSRGALLEVDQTQSDRMHCELVDKLCKHTEHKFIY